MPVYLKGQDDARLDSRLECNNARQQARISTNVLLLLQPPTMSSNDPTNTNAALVNGHVNGSVDAAGRLQIVDEEKTFTLVFI